MVKDIKEITTYLICGFFYVSFTMILITYFKNKKVLQDNTTITGMSIGILITIGITISIAILGPPSFMGGNGGDGGDGGGTE